MQVFLRKRWVERAKERQALQPTQANDDVTTSYTNNGERPLKGSANEDEEKNSWRQAAIKAITFIGHGVSTSRLRVTLYACNSFLSASFYVFHLLTLTAFGVVKRRKSTSSTTRVYGANSNKNFLNQKKTILPEVLQED